MEKLKEWGPLLGAFAGVLAVALIIAGMLIANANRNADLRFQALMQQAEDLNRNVDARFDDQNARFDDLNRNADTRYEALMGQIEAQNRNADMNYEVLMGLIEAQNRNADARYEGLMGQIEGVVGQVVGLQKQIDGLQNQIDGLNRNADARNEILMERTERMEHVFEVLSREMGAINGLLDPAQYSDYSIREIVDAIQAMLETLHDRIVEFESMIELDEAWFDGEYERLEALPAPI